MASGKPAAIAPSMPSPNAGRCPGEAGPPRARRLAMGTPMRAFLERLAACSAEDCAWGGYLPSPCRERLSRGLAPLSCAPGIDAEVADAGAIKGHVMRLARDAQGCRQVQRALEEAENDEMREALASELHGHVWEALQCPHANHVLQKCVAELTPRAVQFVIDELSARGVSQAARHKYGCRIVQRLVEFCPHDQTAGIVECLLAEVPTIARNQYGNYVLQNLLEHGTPEQRRHVAERLLADVASLGPDPYAVAVIGAALVHCTEEEGRPLAEALVRGDMLVSMACSRLGYPSVPKVLESLSAQDQREALRQLLSQGPTLKASRYGQHVLHDLEDGLSEIMWTAPKPRQQEHRQEQRPQHARRDGPPPDPALLGAGARA